MKDDRESKNSITWELREEDVNFFEKELNDFVPEKVYDVHGHLYRKIFWEKNVPDGISVGPHDITLETYRKQMQWILPNREVHGVHLPYPPANIPYDTVSANAWVASEIKKDPLARGHFIVKPTDDPEWVRQEVRRLGLCGLKPFYTFAKVNDLSMAEIPDYLPDQIAAIANEEGWTITLHMVRRKSMADESNIFWIQKYCKKYPNMNIILDHSARGFNPYHTLEGLQKLEKGLNNLWIDTSANCAPLATIAALRLIGIDRVLYASDFFVSHIRGTHVGVNDNFLFLGEELPIWNKNLIEVCKPTFVGLENLRAVKAAFWVMGFGDKEIEKYFWKNAEKLFNL